MNNITLCEKLWDIAENYNTVYMKGVFGAPVTEALIAGKAKQYPEWYTAQKQKELSALIGKGYFGFDCVCLVKAVLWGWCGDTEQVYGGARYCSNGVGDMPVEEFANRCSDVSSDFSSIQKGELLFCPGHIGVYLGNGLCCECTPKWENRVQITAVKNIGEIKGYNSRAWKTHGKFGKIEYTEEAVYGDVNGDGIINAEDYRLLRDAVLMGKPLTDEQKKKCDLNGDGKVCATDYLIARRLFLGNI